MLGGGVAIHTYYPSLQEQSVKKKAPFTLHRFNPCTVTDVMDQSSVHIPT